MKPFLFLGTRSIDLAADGEYDAMLRFSGLDEARLQRVRMEQAPLGPVDLDRYAGVIMGGGPFNASDTEKSQVQVRVETEVSALLDVIVARDLPFLGCCYGIGTLGTHQGGTVDRTYAEPVGPMTVALTHEGRTDPIFGQLPDTFEVFLGHKEAVRELPPNAVNLASSRSCPVQAFRVGENAYATQFHPELDVEGIQTRIDVYKHHGYFSPGEAEELKVRARAATVVHPPTILQAFVARYG